MLISKSVAKGFYFIDLYFAPLFLKVEFIEHICLHERNYQQ